MMLLGMAISIPIIGNMKLQRISFACLSADVNKKQSGYLTQSIQYSDGTMSVIPLHQALHWKVIDDIPPRLLSFI